MWKRKSESNFYFLNFWKRQIQKQTYIEAKKNLNLKMCSLKKERSKKTKDTIQKTESGGMIKNKK